jgi:hypothetical protein
MALVKCRECGNEVSTEATACPHCGVKSPAKEPGMGLFAKIGLTIIGLFIFLIVVGSLGGGSPPTSGGSRQSSIANNEPLLVFCSGLMLKQVVPSASEAEIADNSAKLLAERQGISASSARAKLIALRDEHGSWERVGAVCKENGLIVANP